jgi:putative ABC transport system permease protein
MSWFDRLRNQSRDDTLAHDIDREMQFHLDERADDLVARGMPPQHARDEARRRFGNIGRHKEQTRERNLFAWLDILVSDLRYATRALRSAPGFTIVAIVSLALGIGANTAIFSILNAVMLKSLPVDHPEELVALTRGGSEDFTNPLWEAIRDRQDMFSGAFAFGPATFTLASGGEARRIKANWVSGGFFTTLGVRPSVGRLLAQSDDVRGCPAVVVLGHGFWQSEFGGDASVVGKPMSFDGIPFTVLGVTDPRFFGVDVGSRPQAYFPLCAQTITDAPDALDQRSRWDLSIMARPKPGISIEQIRTRLGTLGPALIDATIPENMPAQAIENYRKAEFSAKEAATGFSSIRSQYKTALYDLMVIVGLVLLVACANVANLLLARATMRRREVAVRLALGAGRARIARQLITESLLLATLGAAAGCAFAWWGSHLLVSLMSGGNQIIALDLAPDGRLLGFTIAVAVLTGLIFGVAPAWQASHVDPQSAMKAQSRGASDGVGRLRVGRALVVSQVAISLVLVTAAALLVGSWRRLATLNPGFRRTQVLLISANLHGAQFGDTQRDAIVQQMLARLRALPGVRDASTAAVTPISGSGWNGPIAVAGYTPASKRDAISWMNAVSERYFSTMGIELLSGRDFDGRESAASPPVAIVDEAMARKFFGTANAVGRTLQLSEGRKLGPPVTVIGVVASSKYKSLRDSLATIVYLPRGQGAAQDERVNFELFADAPLALVPSAKKVVAETDPRITVSITTLERQLAESMPLMRATATVSGFFGGLALLLATIGLYGIVSYSVARRRNEIGVRLALGAGSARVIRMVIGDVGRIVAIGIVVGILLSTAATRIVTTFIYEVQRNDPATLAGSALLLALIGATAAALPAWRASRLDPVAALRED